MKGKLVTVFCLPLLLSCGGGGGGGSEDKSNQPPQVDDVSITLNEDSSVNGQLLATDPENESLSYSLGDLPTKGTVSVNDVTGAFVFIATKDAFGSDSFSLNVSDGTSSVSVTVPVTINPINDAPKTLSIQQTFSGTEDQPVVGTISASDPDGDILSYTMLQNSSNGEVTLDGNQFSYMPAANFNGASSFTVKISDELVSINKTVQLQIAPVNDAPVAQQSILSLETGQNQPRNLTLPVIDVDGDPLSAVVKTAPKNGNASFNGLQLLYSPGDFIGTDLLIATVSDRNISLDITINITVTEASEPPVISRNQVFDAKDGRIVQGQILATDLDSRNLIFSLPAQNLAGNFNLKSNGSFDYTYNGSSVVFENILVNVSDATSTVSGSIRIDITSDPLYSEQWHLNNTGQRAYSASSGVVGQDINIDDLHQNQNNGSGIFVAVVDTGLEINHPDLKNNVISGKSKNYSSPVNSDPSPTSNGGDHGTSVAGLIAAQAYNNIGGRGVAPNASIAGFNFLLRENQSISNLLDSHGGAATADARVINQSFGSSFLSPVPFNTENHDVVEAQFIEITSNNSGRGISFIKSAGNSFCRIFNADQLEFSGVTPDFIYCQNAFSDNTEVRRLTAHVAGIEPMSSSFYETVISALNATGTLSSYSSVGSSVWATAPGGEYGFNQPAMITTDVQSCNQGYATDQSEAPFDRGLRGDNSSCDYTSTFNGTSSAAPVVSGVFALIYQADPSLSWRDARDIVARTATKVDANFRPVILNNGGLSITAEPGWLANAAGFDFHNWYGFGRVNAKAAVTLAKSSSYQKLPVLKKTGFITASTRNITIAENSVLGAEKQINITNNYTVESIQLKISIQHRRDADLMIEVESPQGTKSVVMTPRSLLVYDLSDDYSNSDFFGDYKDTILLSHAFYGENSQGVWKVRVIDTNSGAFRFYITNNFERPVSVTRSNNSSPGQFQQAAIKIYGH
ncbi:tandem-95 repeat protein [Pelagibaculum spongiae]|uniref:P/Homo B domain-containing protein n=1 Tax=Pelagibaculum spongiae TaxID=2080658 RepID=A0A2V1GV03_9GAMM|nr:Ig-like domain-containing protein [Pelagibaculum spongiae]PVZ63414.1 hypothetical protein DC094_21125 [Pelagibaculum spongiae]